MSKRMFVLSVIAAMLLSLSAFAVDGVVLINQASVNAAGGFPYKITVSGSYKLSSNLSVTTVTVDAIDINADNVVLDLNGFSITSVDTTCTPSTSGPNCQGVGGNGIRSISGTNVTVRNGSVTGFSFGALLAGIGNLVEEMHFSGNSIGIEVHGGIVRRSTAMNNSLGILSFQSNLSENAINHNGTGLEANATNYGNNSLLLNHIDVSDFGANTSQHNNNCSGTVC